MVPLHPHTHLPWKEAWSAGPHLIQLHRTYHTKTTIQNRGAGKELHITADTSTVNTNQDPLTTWGNLTA